MITVMRLQLRGLVLVLLFPCLGVFFVSDAACPKNESGSHKNLNVNFPQGAYSFYQGRLEQVPSLDTTFSKGSGITFPQLTKRKIQDLQLLGQIWGFLKYYHPAIASGKYNWDFELFKFLPSYLNVKTNKMRDDLLSDWINKFGPISSCSSCKISFDADIKMKPDLKWMTLGKLQPSLKKKLSEILDNRNQSKNYYVSILPPPKSSGNPTFTNENPYKQFNLPDDGFRLLALFRYWNMIQYFFPYKYAIGEDWNNVLMEFIPRFILANNEIQYRLVSLELVGRINDSHANIWDSSLEKYKGAYIAPLQTKFIQNQLVVTDTFSQFHQHVSGIEIGDVISSIDGMPVGKIVDAKIKYYPASNHVTKLRNMALDIFRGDSGKLNLTLERRGRTFLKQIKRVHLTEVDMSKLYISNQPDSCYGIIEDSVGYIYLGNVKQNLLPRIFERLRPMKGIVIDIRNYPGDQVLNELAEFFLPSEQPFVKFTIGNQSYPGLFTWRGSPNKIGKQNPDYYKGKVAILVNEVTQSHAEYTAMALKTIPNAVIVGSTTAGADGNTSRMYLPGNLLTMISGIGVYYPNGGETQRVGIVPDIEIQPTIMGVKEGRDEVLEKAVQIIRKN